jgi:hypothetical protein
MKLKFYKFIILFLVGSILLISSGCRTLFVKDPSRAAHKKEKRELKETQKVYNKEVKAHYKSQGKNTEKRMKKNYRNATKKDKKKKKSYWRCR